MEEIWLGLKNLFFLERIEQLEAYLLTRWDTLEEYGQYQVKS